MQDGPAKADGVALGKAAAEHMLTLRRHDKMREQASYVPKHGPGAFQLPANATPLGPHWGAVTPFTLESLQDFRFPGPPALTSARYAQDFNEVKAVGAKHSTLRTVEQTAIAMLWEPPGTLSYNAALRAMPDLTQKRMVEQARVFALLNMAGSDALIVGWRDKYLHLFWRPETAIRNADSDGNEATAPDPAWEGLRSPFPAHPEYPSGHALFTGVVETVLRDFFGTDRMTMTVTNPEAQITRSFASFSEIAQSVEDARVGGDSFPQRRHRWHRHGAADRGICAEALHAAARAVTRREPGRRRPIHERPWCRQADGGLQGRHDRSEPACHVRDRGYQALRIAGHAHVSEVPVRAYAIKASNV